MNAGRVKFSGGHFDLFFSGYIVMLTYFHLPYLAIEIPVHPRPEWRGDHWLRRIKLDESTVQINARHTNDALFVDGKQVCVCHHASAMHLKLEKLFSVDVFHTSNAVQHRLANFPISVCF